MSYRVFSFLPGIITRHRIIIITEQKPAEEFFQERKEKNLKI